MSITPARLLAALAAAAAVAPAAAAAQADPSISVAPSTAALDERVTVRGRDFVVFESCARRVTVRLRSAQNEVRLGRARVRESGRVRFRFVARDHNVGPGRWRVVVSQRCESGRDGSRFFRRASARLRLR
ncbi:MAG TPA: hypothetical protein VHF89_12515 [Solirubrobacteraceae bacterium]|nr:hypothetical protein [Solirubrobacteraceae bacterium]